MNMNALWALDIIIAAGMIIVVTVIVMLGRTIALFSRSVSGVLGDVAQRTADLESEAIRLMQATERTERHVDHLLEQLAQLSSSADTAVRSLPPRGPQTGLRLPAVLSTAVSIASAYRFFKSVFLRRKS